MAGQNHSQKTTDEQNGANHKNKGGCLWRALMVIGVLSLITFCIMLGAIMFGGRDTVVDWGSIAPVLVGSLIIGGALVYFASRHVGFPKDKKPAQAPVKATLLMFSPGDIMCMAVVYEGHLPQGHVLNLREFAEEIIASAHQTGLPEHIHLAPDTIIQAKRADENAYYAGDYEPKDDLPDMMNSMVSSLRGRVSAGGQTSGSLNTKQMMFKSWSQLASTVWVSLTVMQ